MDPRIARSVSLLLSETATVSGQDYLDALVRCTATVLHTRHAFIGRISPDGRRVEVLTHWMDGAPGPRFEYALEGTPCASTTAEGACQHPRDVRAAFPDDHLLDEMGIEAYFGMAVAAGGRRLGVLVALDVAPREPIESLESVLRLFADRAALEIERMESESRLRASEARYRQLIARCAEGVWTIDRDNVTEFVNPQMATMLGLASAEMIGRPVFDFMDEDSRRLAERALARRREGVTERHSLRLRHRTGHDVWVELASSPIEGQSGEYVGAIAFVTDVTERRRLQEGLQQRQKLDSLAVLAGGVAHDFNNLLVGVLSNADVVLADPELEPWVRASVQEIHEASLRAAELTRRLLAYAGRSHFEPRPFELGPWLHAHATPAQAAAGDCTLHLQLDGELPAVHGDPSQLAQVLLNLVANARDALGPGGGHIRVSAGVVGRDDPLLARIYAADSVAAKPHVWFRVEDQGPGMDEATIARVFDPFFTTKDGAHGLGLAAALGIVRRHGGGMVVDSRLGRGTAISVLLPVSDVRPRQKTPSAGRLRTASLTGVRVLVVDDEAMVRSVSARILEAEGAAVQEADDGVRALERIEAEPTAFDLVLLDMTMPNMGGAETLVALRERGHRLPVLLSSGFSAAALPSDDTTSFIAKPFRALELVTAVRRALERAAAVGV